ncbi:hypothetical protein BGZ73_008909 [Actinomortierella ambigua]|nr:hypothetical protein BGZ73_008909 [Actinomortierella ambigua]
MPSCPIGSKVFRTLLETHSQNLETLELSGKLEPAMNASPWIQRLLTSCPRLKVLLAMYSREEVTEGVHLHADDILTGSWVCRYLTTLMIPIVVGPKNGQVAKEGSSDRSAIVHRVMQQIGRMSKLTALGTSKEPYIIVDGNRSLIHRGSIVPDLLSFTLGSGGVDGRGGGLQHLAGLKHMRELCISRCALDLGTDEEEWMKKHWPDMEIISR